MRSIVTFVFSSWFVLTVFGQHPGGSHRSRYLLQRLSSTIFMPNWAFFAPDPGTHDDHLLYREVKTPAGDDSESYGEWREIQYSKAIPFLSHFYSKRSRQGKGIIDIFSTLESIEGQTKYQADKDVVLGGRQAIANYVSANANHTSNDISDFDVLLVKTAGYETSADPIYHYKFRVREGLARL